MLGIARTAQLAGWGSREPVLRTSSTVSMSTPVTGLARPNRYADYSVTNQIPGNNVLTNFTSSSQGNFDMSGIGLNSQSGLQALTFRVSTDFMAAGVTQYTQGFSVFNSFKSPGSQVFRNLDFFKIEPFGDQQVFRINMFGSEGIALTESQMNAVRNQWVTVICAYSTDTSIFANWNPVYNNPGAQTYCRTILVHAETSEIIQQQDAPSSYGCDSFDLSQQFTLGYTTDHSFDHNLNCISDSWLNNNVNQLQIGGLWSAVGSSLDPLETSVRQQLSGVARPNTVSGLRSWNHIRFDGAINTVINQYAETAGYRCVMQNNSRAPSDSVYDILIGYQVQDPVPPVFVDY